MYMNCVVNNLIIVGKLLNVFLLGKLCYSISIQQLAGVK